MMLLTNICFGFEQLSIYFFRPIISYIKEVLGFFELLFSYLKPKFQLSLNFYLASINSCSVFSNLSFATLISLLDSYSSYFVIIFSYFDSANPFSNTSSFYLVSINSCSDFSYLSLATVVHIWFLWALKDLNETKISLRELKMGSTNQNKRRLLRSMSYKKLKMNLV